MQTTDRQARKGLHSSLGLAVLVVEQKGADESYGPSMSQMFAEQYTTEDGWRRLPLAPLQSTSNSAAASLTRPATSSGSLFRDLDFPNPEQWVLYAAQYANLPAHLAPPAPVWPFVATAIHFSGYSSGSYTATAFEAEYLGGTLTWSWFPCGFLTSVWARTNVTQRQNLLPN